MKTISNFRCFFALLSAIILSGCYESKEQYILNPGGSGKVHLEVDAVFTTNFLIKEFNAEKELHRQVRNILNQSEGIEVWSDLKYVLTEKGRFIFSGTAYFKNFNSLKIRGIASGQSFRASTESSQGFQYTFSAENGILRLALQPPENPPEEILDEEISKKETERRVKHLRVLFNQSWPLLAFSLKDLRQEKRFLLPGHPGTTQGFEKDEVSGEWVKIISGNELLALIEESVENPEYWERRARLTGEPEKRVYPTAHEIYQLLESRGPLPDARMHGPFTDAFDYEAEVTKARPRYEQVRARLRIPVDPPLAPPSQNGQIQKAEVVGVRNVWKGNHWSKIKPFGEPDGFELAVLVTLDGSVLKVNSADVTSVYTSERFVMMPKPSSVRDSKTFSLSEDRSQVLFYRTVDSPPVGARALDEIMGEISFVTGSKTKTVTLGILELKGGATLEPYRTRIVRVENIKEEGQDLESFDIDFTLDPIAIRNLFFYTEDGEKLMLQRRHPSMWSVQKAYTFTSETPLPEKIRIDMEGYTDLQKHVVPFVIEDLDLLGRPLGN